MRSAVAGNSPGDNLAAFGNVILQQLHILEVDEIGFFNAEPADSPAVDAASAA